MVYGWENLREYSTANLNTFDLTVYSSGNWVVNYDDVNITRHSVSVGSVGDYATGEWDQYLYQQGSYYGGTGTDINDVSGYTGYTGVVDTASESDGVCVGDASDVDCQTESIAMTEEATISYVEDEEVIEVAAVSSTVTDEEAVADTEEEEVEEEVEETEEEAEPEPEQEAEAEVETEVAEVEVETEVETETVEMEVVELVQPVAASFIPTFQIKEVVDMGSYEAELIEQVAMVEQTEDWYADGGGYADDGMEDSGLLAGYNNSIQDNGEWY
jgi:glutamyl/glutaminyl-tRNA synthetase